MLQSELLGISATGFGVAAEDACQEFLKTGYPLDNGWRVVVHNNEDDPHSLIPVEQFVGHLAAKELPVSKPGTVFFSHDMGHLPSYRALLRHAGLAGTIAIGAQMSQDTRKACVRLGTAVDRLSEEHTTLAFSSSRLSLERARVRLRSLLKITGVDSRKAVDTYGENSALKTSKPL